MEVGWDRGSVKGSKGTIDVNVRLQVLKRGSEEEMDARGLSSAGRGNKCHAQIADVAVNIQNARRV